LEAQETARDAAATIEKNKREYFFISRVDIFYANIINFISTGNM
jgi:hypothetical protein